jgi:hypothetical protein
MSPVAPGVDPLQLDLACAAALATSTLGTLAALDRDLALLGLLVRGLK